MYDWANSAYITTFGAIVAVFFASTIVPDEGFAGLSGETLWAGVVGIGSFILFLVMPILGTVADYGAIRHQGESDRRDGSEKRETEQESALGSRVVGNRAEDRHHQEEDE